MNASVVNKEPAKHRVMFDPTYLRDDDDELEDEFADQHAQTSHSLSYPVKHDEVSSATVGK